MSASTDRRVARLVGRIAEERAARGRPTISHAPRTARTFSVVVVEPPDVEGGEAKLVRVCIPRGQFLRNFTETEVEEGRQVHRRKDIFVRREPPFQDQFVLLDRDHDSAWSRADISVGAGQIDYLEIVTHRHSDADHYRKPIEDPADKDRKISIVDRLFQGF